MIDVVFSFEGEPIFTRASAVLPAARGHNWVWWQGSSCTALVRLRDTPQAQQIFLDFAIYRAMLVAGFDSRSVPRETVVYERFYPAGILNCRRQSPLRGVSE